MDRKFYLKELKSLITLSIPIVIAQVGQILMGIVDTYFVGQISPVALSAVGAGANLTATFIIIGMGFLFGLDPIISQLFGAKNFKKCRHFLVQGIYLSLLISLIASSLHYLMAHYYYLFNPNTQILPPLKGYLKITTFSLPFVFIFTAFQRYWQAKQIVIPFMVIVLLANIINAIADYGLVFGRWGFPRLGSDGAAYATLFSRAFMCLAMFYYTISHKNPLRLFFKSKPNPLQQRSILKLGTPAALQMAVEVSAFALFTIFSTQFGPIQASSHHLSLLIVSVTFTVCVGFSSATCVRVGQFIGSENFQEARSSGWLGILMTACFMSVSSIFLFIFPNQLISLFTKNEALIAYGSTILFFAAIFQISDGLQVTLTGALRGLGETKLPLFANLIGHLFVTFPVGLTFCYLLDWQVKGLWLGLTTGLTTVAILLIFYWKKRSALFINSNFRF